jgi:hypothetical protein
MSVRFDHSSGFSFLISDIYSELQCDLLIQRCRGLDTTEVVDDEGGLPKTVSVENSFRQSTIRSLELVWRALEDLFVRLPRLLQDRTSWSLDPDHAFPTTIRFTIRMVDPSLLHKRRRRPYVTRSKQSPFNGKAFLKQDKNEEQQSVTLKRCITPLLRQLLSDAMDINVTRMNIAVTNFQDVARQAAVDSSSTQVSISACLQSKRESPSSTTQDVQIDSTIPMVKKSRLAYHLDQSQTSNGHNSSRDPKPKAPDLGELTSSPHTLPVVTNSANAIPSKGTTRMVREKLARPARMKATQIDHFFWKKK